VRRKTRSGGAPLAYRSQMMHSELPLPLSPAPREWWKIQRLVCQRLTDKMGSGIMAGMTCDAHPPGQQLVSRCPPSATQASNPSYQRVIWGPLLDDDSGLERFVIARAGAQNTDRQPDVGSCSLMGAKPRL
jgi:hypothetical protein